MPDPNAHRPAPRLPRRRWWLLALPLAAAGVAAGWLTTRPKTPAPRPTWTVPARLTVPPPPPEVLAVQAEAVAGDGAVLDRLEQQMRPYRASLRTMPDAVARAHAEADRLMDAGQAADAGRILAGIVETAPPALPDPAAKEARRILIQDAYFRLCRLALSAGQVIVSGLQTHHALALSDPNAPDDTFTINLRLVRAVAHDRMDEPEQASVDRQRLLKLFPRP